MGMVYDLDLPANEQSVLLALADHADHYGNNCFPSNGLVAWKIGMSDDSVIRIKKKLIAKNILIPVRSSAGEPKRYRIAIENGTKKEPYHLPQDAVPPGTGVPQIAGGVPQSYAGGGTAKLCGTNHQEPSIEPSVPSPVSESGNPGPEAQEKPKSYHQLFIEAYCTTYEAKRGEPYPFSLDAGRNAKAAQKMAQSLVPLEKVVRVLEAALDHADGFHCKNAVPLYRFVENYTGITNELNGLLKSKQIKNPPNRPPSTWELKTRIETLESAKARLLDKYGTSDRIPAGKEQDYWREVIRSIKATREELEKACLRK